MALAGEDHGGSEAIAGGDDLVVADRASGLEDGPDAGLDGGLHAVGEGEEGVGGQDGACDVVARLVDGHAHGVHAAHLARADPQDPVSAGQDDGVRLHVLGDLLGEEQGLELFVGGGQLRDPLQLRARSGAQVAILEQEAPDQLLDLDVALAAHAGVVLAAGQEPYALAPLGLARQELEGVVVEGGRDDGLDEAVARDQEVGAGQVDRPREGQHRAEGREGIAGPGRLEGVLDSLGHRRAAGVVVLGDRHKGLVELLGQGVGGVQVDQVVVGERLAVQDLGLRHRGLVRAPRAVEGRALVRVLAVAQVERLGAGHGEARSEGRLGQAVRGLLLEHPAADGRVVARGQGEGLAGQLPAQLVGEAALVLLQLVQHPAVVLGVGDDAHVAVVLGRRAHHGRPADVDLLDGVGAAHVRPLDGRLEGVEVHDHQVDALDPVRGHRVRVARLLAQGEDAAVDLGVQGLDPAVHHLGEARVRGHLGDGHAGLLQGRVGAAGREDLGAHLRQGAREVLDAGLVRDADQGAPHLGFHARLQPTRARRKVLGGS